MIGPTRDRTAKTVAVPFTCAAQAHVFFVHFCG